MLAIVNVSTDADPLTGPNKYEVRVNKRVIATFMHNRQYGNAAQCLRDAAKAVERQEREAQAIMLQALCRLTDEEKQA